jgi:hypothetical protein
MTPWSALRVNSSLGRKYCFHLRGCKVWQIRNQHETGSKQTLPSVCFLLDLQFKPKHGGDMFLRDIYWHIYWLHCVIQQRIKPFKTTPMRTSNPINFFFFSFFPFSSLHGIGNQLHTLISSFSKPSSVYASFWLMPQNLFRYSVTRWTNLWRLFMETFMLLNISEQHYGVET